ncbi:hypothetical protein [Paenibacillus sp. Leaf72]|uniref:hypothetical protein n=1 Tax=Paenibacillus sp. Leaf72 TaxID=1736234 RepID=UPI0006F684F8|nr:hypothetical protein [Paenibacillus sp. Leaf72]KQO17914.1 hypothetical protein ASF12_04455 [Paenibacillus sp. Leaf72]
MSTALLQELHQEVRRLYIAGSDLAAGDFRLKRLLPQFEQLGERAAIFKKLGEGIAALLESAEGTGAAVKLQELAVLLGSVLYTQGHTAVDGEVLDLAGGGVPLSTSYSYRKLAEVQKALSTTGSGRYEIVTDAFAEGLFNDLRLFPFAIRALDDPYSEMAEFAMDKILPAYGSAVVPYLIQCFNRSGGKSDVRKLRVIYKAGGAAELDLIFDAAENGADEIRVAAIECLAAHEEYADALIGWTLDKKKPIREAAYAALAAGASAQGTERLFAAFSGKDIELAAEALNSWPSEPLTERLIPLFRAELDQAPVNNKDEKASDKAWAKVQPFLRAFEYVRMPQLEELYDQIVREADRFTALSWITLLDKAAQYLEQTNSMEVLSLLQELDHKNHRYLPYSFRMAKRLLPPEEVYMHYVGSTASKLKSVVTKASSARERQLLDTMEYMVGSYDYYNGEINTAAPLVEAWDARWLDWLIDRKHLELVAVFARPGHKRVEEFLLQSLQEWKEKKKSGLNTIGVHVFKGLEHAGVEETRRLELLMEILEDSKDKSLYSFSVYLFHLMFHFPKSYADRLEAILPSYRYDCARQLEEIIGLLRK